MSQLLASPRIFGQSLRIRELQCPSSHARGREDTHRIPRLARTRLKPCIKQWGVLIEFRDTLRTSYRDENFEVPYPTMNLGCLHAGDNPNRICENARLEIDLRLLPGQEPEPMLNSLNKCMKEVAFQTGTEIEIGARITPGATIRRKTRGEADRNANEYHRTLAGNGRILYRGAVLCTDGNGRRGLWARVN